MSNDILVFAEHLNGNLEDVTFELLGKGRELAGQSGGQLAVALLGNDIKNLAGKLGAADKVFSVNHAQLASFNPEAYGKALAAVVAAGEPKLILIPNTSMGMDLAAALSAASDIPLVAYAVDVRLESGAPVVVSQLYGGKVNVESQLEGEQNIVSVIAGSFLAEAGQKEGAPAVEELPAPEGLDALRVRFRRLIQPEAGDVDITQQDVLVSIGRGIQSEDNIPIAQELADALGGAVSCSRPIVDNKWLPKVRQVGKSGLKVKPKLYLALGISGAPEHIEGMKDAELIVAVNADPEAPIFDYAHYGYVGDLFDIVPALTEKVKG